MWMFFDAGIFALGYAASVYTWPAVRVWINGVGAEATSLRAKAATLEAKIAAR